MTPWPSMTTVRIPRPMTLASWSTTRTRMARPASSKSTGMRTKSPDRDDAHGAAAVAERGGRRSPAFGSRRGATGRAGHAPSAAGSWRSPHSPSRPESCVGTTLVPAAGFIPSGQRPAQVGPVCGSRSPLCRTRCGRTGRACSSPSRRSLRRLRALRGRASSGAWWVESGVGNASLPKRPSRCSSVRDRCRSGGWMVDTRSNCSLMTPMTIRVRHQPSRWRYPWSARG